MRFSPVVKIKETDEMNVNTAIKDHRADEGHAARRRGSGGNGNIMRIRGKRHIGGFTLVEMMIVISVIGLIAILSLPGYSRFMQNWRLNGDTQQFASVLRTARSAAIMKNIDVVFVFDLDTDTYFYFEDVDRNGSRGSNEFRSGTYNLSECVRITAHTLSNNTLTFGSKGNTRESGSITLRNTNNKIRDIRIFGGTGNVTVH